MGFNNTDLIKIATDVVVNYRTILKNADVGLLDNLDELLNNNFTFLNVSTMFHPEALTKIADVINEDPRLVIFAHNVSALFLSRIPYNVTIQEVMEFIIKTQMSLFTSDTSKDNLSIIHKNNSNYLNHDRDKLMKVLQDNTWLSPMYLYALGTLDNSRLLT